MGEAAHGSFLNRMQSPSSTEPSAAGWRFDHTYTRLPTLLFARQRPTAVSGGRLVVLNKPLTKLLGLNVSALDTAYGARVFAGNEVPEGADPIAQAYAGHQFGHFTMLGDGRAILVGEHITPLGARVDIQWKGAGPTAYTRGGDGRAVLGPMLREYIMGEAMHALGIPTTRALAVAATGDSVMRAAVLPGAVLTRVAASHIRVGTFEYAAARKDVEALRALADYTIQRHDPGLYTALRLGDSGVYVAWLRAVVERQAQLIARWLLVGFIHGVMNTDNMAISGETIDYGPCAWMDVYDTSTVFSSIDHQGRYAYGNQPRIAQWNLARFAEAILPLLHPVSAEAVGLAEEVLRGFGERFEAHWLEGMRAKLGLVGDARSAEEDGLLAQDFLTRMGEARADYTQTLRALAEWASGDACGPAWAQPWVERWRKRLAQQPGDLSQAVKTMRAHNPARVARNHLVEAALASAGRGDFSVMQALVEALQSPFEDFLPESPFAQDPPQLSRPYQTFCGT